MDLPIVNEDQAMKIGMKLALDERPDTFVVVQGFPYDEDAWKLVAEQAHNLGNKIMERFEGDSGHLYWDIAGKLDDAIKEIAYINANQQYAHGYDLDDDGKLK